MCVCVCVCVCVWWCGVVWWVVCVCVLCACGWGVEDGVEGQRRTIMLHRAWEAGCSYIVTAHTRAHTQSRSHAHTPLSHTLVF